MWASPFQVLLYNLREWLPETSLHFISREEALRRLREMTNQDFGSDDFRWEQWGREQRLFYPGT
jgi:hypothetical protein